VLLPLEIERGISIEAAVGIRGTLAEAARAAGLRAVDAREAATCGGSTGCLGAALWNLGSRAGLGGVASRTAGGRTRVVLVAVSADGKELGRTSVEGSPADLKTKLAAAVTALLPTLTALPVGYASDQQGGASIWSSAHFEKIGVPDFTTESLAGTAPYQYETRAQGQSQPRLRLRAPPRRLPRVDRDLPPVRRRASRLPLGQAAPRPLRRRPPPRLRGPLRRPNRRRSPNQLGARRRAPAKTSRSAPASTCCSRPRRPATAAATR
jgi:hypothetical protein